MLRPLSLQDASMLGPTLATFHQEMACRVSPRATCLRSEFSSNPWPVSIVDVSFFESLLAVPSCYRNWSEDLSGSAIARRGLKLVS